MRGCALQGGGEAPRKSRRGAVRSLRARARAGASRSHPGAEERAALRHPETLRLLAPGLVELQERADLRLERGVGPFLGAVERPDDPAPRRNQKSARHLVAQAQPVREPSLRRAVALERLAEAAAIAPDATARV